MSLALLIRHLPLLFGAGAAALAVVLWLRLDTLRGAMDQMKQDLTEAQATIEAWERIEDADVSSGDAIADRDWLLNRGK